MPIPYPCSACFFSQLAVSENGGFMNTRPAHSSDKPLSRAVKLRGATWNGAAAAAQGSKSKPPSWSKMYRGVSQVSPSTWVNIPSGSAKGLRFETAASACGFAFTVSDYPPRRRICATIRVLVQTLGTGAAASAG